MSILGAFIGAGVGLVISLYMVIKKAAHKPLVCPREAPCDRVLGSTFSKTFGIPNELLGVGYFLTVLALLLVPVSAVTTPWMLYALFYVLIGGGLFSLYLIGLQAFVLRAWCAWCLSIAVANLLLIVSLAHFPVAHIVPLITAQKLWWVIVHNIGFILGVGTATITDIFFFRFLKDGVITQDEKETMDTLSTVIWVALAVLITSGISLYLTDIPRLAVSAKFLFKVVVVGVIAVNGVLLNMYVGPHLRRLSFAGIAPARRFRRFAFALGGISFTSWYIAFFLGSFRSISIALGHALVGYGVFLVCVIIGSQVFERIVSKKFGK